MTSTHQAELPIPALPLTAPMAHIVPKLQSHLLVSIGTLWDVGCDVTFTTTTVTVKHKYDIVLTGTHTPSGLWHFAIPTTALLHQTHEDVALSTIGYPNAAELVAYAHVTFFSAALSTLEHALQKVYVGNLPGLTAITLWQHPPTSVATIKGHLD